MWAVIIINKWQNFYYTQMQFYHHLDGTVALT